MKERSVPCPRYRAATEVRCTEQSKGGLKYELVLADPCTESPVRKPISSSPPKSISAEDIQKKLKEAEERRQSLEAQKLNQLNEKLSRLAEVNQKREGLAEEFQEATRQSYEKKIEAFKENREAHIKSIQEKQREHVRLLFLFLSLGRFHRLVREKEYCGKLFSFNCVLSSAD